MRPPTRSTRSVRPHPNKTTTNTRRSRGASGPSTTPLLALASSETTSNNTTPPPRPRAQPIKPTSAASADDAKVDPGTSPGSSLAPAPSRSPLPPIMSCFPVLPPPPATTTFVFENHDSESPLVGPHGHGHSSRSAGPAESPFISVVNAKPPARSRHRMSSDKLETLDAFFRRKTHPSRKEKEAICKDLDMDLKTVTIWFQNKRQTVARSRKLLQSEGVGAATTKAYTPTGAMDMLASASAKMSPLVADDATAVKPSASSTSAPASVQVQLGSGARRSPPECPSSLGRSPSRLPHTTSLSCDSVPTSQPLNSSRVLSAVSHDPDVFESARAAPSSSTCASSLSPDLCKPRRLGRNWPIHPEDLWKHIPSSPALPVLSSPDVSSDISTPSRTSRFSVQRPPTLEWACARSAKRRRTNPDPIHYEDGETDSECNSVDRPDACRSSFAVSEARVPLECYDEYPLDVVRGAVLLLGLRDARRGLGI